MVDLKLYMYLYVEELQLHGVQLSRRSHRLHPTMHKILAIHEASRKCVWLRSMIQYICRSCGNSSEKEEPTVLHEDNVAYIA